MTSLRSCMIGCWMGITPAGATPASFMSYGIAKRVSKNGNNFGKGEIEGVVAPETAAHAAGTAALLPMLSLGVPGSPTAAVLLGGLLIWGLQPGPMLFVEQKEFVWGLIASMYLGNLVGLIVVLTCVPIFAAILRVPFSIIAPLILVLCAIGAYSVHSRTFDVMLMLVFGVIGYLLKKCNYPLAPLVLAIVLGDKAEEAFRQSLLGSQGSLGVFFSNTLVSTIMILGLIALFWSVIQQGYTRLRARGRLNGRANTTALRSNNLIISGSKGRAKSARPFFLRMQHSGNPNNCDKLARFSLVYWHNIYQTPPSSCRVSIEQRFGGKMTDTVHGAAPVAARVSDAYRWTQLAIGVARDGDDRQLPIWLDVLRPRHPEEIRMGSRFDPVGVYAVRAVRDLAGAGRRLVRR